MITAAALELPVRRWVPDRLAVAGLFSVLLPVTMLNGSYTGSMLEVSNTLGSNAEDITMGYYAASAGMAIAYPIVPKVLGAVSSKVLLLADLTLQFLLSWFCARSQSADTLIVCSFFIGCCGASGGSRPSSARRMSAANFTPTSTRWSSAAASSP